MHDILMKVPERDLVPVILCSMLIICSTLVLLTAILARAWGRYSRRQLATPLLREMMDRGMQPSEIEDIFEAAWSTRRGYFSALAHKVFGRRQPVVRRVS